MFATYTNRYITTGQNFLHIQIIQGSIYFGYASIWLSNDSIEIRQKSFKEKLYFESERKFKNIVRSWNTCSGDVEYAFYKEFENVRTLCFYPP